MACTNCKQKKIEVTGEEKFQRRAGLVEKWIPWFLLVWSMLAIYGIVCLIQKFI